jgi:glycosyltransferase involved in cell wall biosynthesis
MESTDRVPITIVVLALNEERNLPDCLASVAGWASEIFVVDSGSTDRTVEMAQSYGATIAYHPFETHARQWDWALKNLPCRSEWVLALDADQRVTPELRAELGRLFAEEGSRLSHVDGFYIKRRQIFRGRWIRHGGYFPKYLLKLFRRGQTRTDTTDLVDHHFSIAGHVAKLQHDLIEANQKENDLSFWIEKHNRYATLLAREELQRRRGDRRQPVAASLLGTPDERTAWLKRLWYRQPLYVRPFLYFLYRYVLRLGFLDGKEGFIFHFLQAFWFRLLVDIQLDEMLNEAEPFDRQTLNEEATELKMKTEQQQTQP